jgi:hypothetical protein
MKLPVLSPTDQSWLWRWGLCVWAILFPVIASQFGAGWVEWVVVSPFGYAENITTLLVAVGVAYAIAIARLPQGRHLKIWMAVYALALIFFAGEDQNWFQYWLDTEVPDYFLVNNKEQETNLHNINSWFNQKPRLMVEAWLLIACVLVPMGWWTWPKRATRQFVPADLWPDRRIVALALGILAFGQLRRLFKYLGEAGVPLPANLQGDGLNVMTETFPGVRISELQEIGFAYIMLLFAAMLYGRLASAKPVKKHAKKSK